LTPGLYPGLGLYAGLGLYQYRCPAPQTPIFPNPDESEIIDA